MNAGTIVIIVLSSLALLAFLIFLYIWFGHPTWRYRLNMNAVPDPTAVSRMHEKWEKKQIEQTAEDIKFAENEKELRKSKPNTFFHQTMFDTIATDLQ